MRKIVFAIIFILTYLSVFGQDESKQVLVFRNTGEVNLFYSEQLDSITFSRMDKDSVWHDTIVSQIFYAIDTALIVPVAEIDSVAFGSRNEIRLKDDVKNLIESGDIDYIIRYDGNYVYYKKNTPKEILPKKGDKLLYADRIDIFPNGLCAEVLDVIPQEDEYAVHVKDISLHDVFDRLFYAGTIKHNEKIAIPSDKERNVGITGNSISYDGTINAGNGCTIAMNGTVTWNLRSVVNWGYYHVEGSVDLDFGYSTDLTANGEIYYESDELARAQLPLIAMVLKPEISLSAFADFDAELGFKYKMHRQWHNKFSWTRKNGENTFWSEKNADKEEAEDDEAELELLCDGSLYFGPKITLDMGLLFNVVGAGMNFKVGPEFSGNLGIGILRKMSETYNSEVYGSSKIDMHSKVGLEGYVTKPFNEDDKTVIFKLEYTSEDITLDLFPQFFDTRGVVDRLSSKDEVSVSVKNRTDVVFPLEVGFELLDEQNNVLDSVFVEKTVDTDNDLVQGFDTVFSGINIPDEMIKKSGVRPVFHYREYTVLAEKAPLSSDCLMQPIISYQTNGISSYISGLPFTGYAKSGETAYLVGNYLPLVIKDTVFGNNDDNRFAGIFIEEEKEELLYGEWSGTMQGEDVVISFLDNGIGTLTDTDNVVKNFTYKINYPQSGQITLFIEDREVVVLYVMYISYDMMRIRMSDGKEYELLKMQ